MLRTTSTELSMERRSEKSSWEAGVIPQLGLSQGSAIEDGSSDLISKYADSQMSIQLGGSPSSLSDHLADLGIYLINTSQKSIHLHP